MDKFGDIAGAYIAKKSKTISDSVMHTIHDNIANALHSAASKVQEKGEEMVPDLGPRPMRLPRVGKTPSRKGGRRGAFAAARRTNRSHKNIYKAKGPQRDRQQDIWRRVKAAKGQMSKGQETMAWRDPNPMSWHNDTILKSMRPRPQSYYGHPGQKKKVYPRRKR